MKSFSSNNILFTFYMFFCIQMSVRFDKATAKPGDNITTTIKADSNSYVCMIGRDKSVSLLSKGHDITESTVSNVLSFIIQSSCIEQLFACTYLCVWLSQMILYHEQSIKFTCVQSNMLRVIAEYTKGTVKHKSQRNWQRHGKYKEYRGTHRKLSLIEDWVLCQTS